MQTARNLAVYFVAARMMIVFRCLNLIGFAHQQVRSYSCATAPALEGGQHDDKANVTLRCPTADYNNGRLFASLDACGVGSILAGVGTVSGGARSLCRSSCLFLDMPGSFSFALRLVSVSSCM